MAIDGKSLFHFAPHELSHSAFWAWVLECSRLKRAGSKYHEISGKLGDWVLELGGLDFRDEIAAIETEICKGKNRFDIVVFLEGNKCLIIEHKLGAGLDTKQLAEYDKIDNIVYKNKHYAVQPHKIFLCSGFDFGFSDWLQSTKSKWQPLTYEMIKEFFNNLKGFECNAILKEYYHWSTEQWDQWAEVQKDLFNSQDGPKRLSALSLEIGQWKLFDFLFKSIDFQLKGILYNGYNKNGLPWTQFCFHRPSTPEEGDYDQSIEYPDALFYRIDNSPNNGFFYITLKQYLHPCYFKKEINWDRDIMPMKKARLLQLRAIFEKVVIEKEFSDLKSPYKTPNRGKYESEIGSFRIPSDYNLTNLREKIHYFSTEFMMGLKNEGWPFNKSKFKG